MDNLPLSDIKNQFKQAQLRKEKSFFIFKTVITILIYIGLSKWHSTGRTTPGLLAWILAISQILCYFLIFEISYKRFKELGYKKIAWMIIILAFVGRVEDWEIIVIPSLVIVMLIFTFINNTLSLKQKEFYKQ